MAKPTNLFEYLDGTLTSPLFLAGAGLASGEGFGGAMQGMKMGLGAQEARQKQQQQQQLTQTLNDPTAFQGVPPEIMRLAQATRDPAGISNFLAKKHDPMSGLNRQLVEAKLRNLQGGGPGEFGKAGSVFQGKDGKFYTIQFGSRGERNILPVEVDGTPLSPAKGVFQVGDELTDKATGMPVRNVAPQLANEEIAKGEGKNVAKVRAELPEARQRLTMITGNLDRLKQTAINVRDHKGLGSVVGGLYQAYAPNVSEDARNAGTELENLKVQISGTVLQAMRDASKTGGAVGQVTEREWPRLENMLANLDPRQGREQFMRNLASIITYVDQVKAALQQAYEADVAVASRGGGAVTPSAPQRLRFNPQTGELE